MDVVGYPADGSTGIPTNTVLLYNELSPNWPDSYHELALCDGSGNEVYVGPLENDFWRCVFMLGVEDPDDEYLLPNETYSVMDNSSCDYGEPIATFTTGEHTLGSLEVSVGEDDPGKGVLVPYESNNEIVMVFLRWNCWDIGCETMALTPIDGMIDVRQYTSNATDGSIESLNLCDGAGQCQYVEIDVESPLVEESSCGCAAVGRREKRTLSTLFVLSIALLTCWMLLRSRRWR